MTYEFYKVLHVLGILGLLSGVGAAAILGLVGEPNGAHSSLRKTLMMTHGVALMVIVVAGFGMMARKGIGIGAAAGADTGWPGWLYGKIGIWLAFGALAGFIRRRPESGRHILWVAPLLGAVAAYLAVVQPGAGPGG
jgi:hypothetical protein